VSNVDLSRLQFGMTTLYHFIFVPVTIGLAWLTAIMQTAWHRTQNLAWLRLTRFVGKLLLINVAVGVATGLVQEFQFGMNWSSYSRFVGDVFGAPLAIEGLAAFFLESTFLGIWIFGWDKLSPRLHLATIYLTAVGATLSALFILAANSWMQNPVGFTINSSGRAELTNIGALFSNRVFLWALPHTLLDSLVVGSAIVLAIACWHLRRGREPEVFRRAAVLALIVLFPASGLALFTGARLAFTLTPIQPMKIASMEALWNTEAPASFSLFQIGGFTPQDQTPSVDIEIPHLLSILATNTWDGQVTGINQANAQEQKQYGTTTNYIPNVQVTFWALRGMAYFGSLMLLLSGLGLFLVWRRKITSARWYQRLATWAVVLPFLIGLSGWLLAEMGRQPWIVWGQQLTQNGISPSLSTAQIVGSLASFMLLYAALALIDIWLMVHFGRRELEPLPASPEETPPVLVPLSY
jgi:cytochrome bd-type quinol oxidase subunit 1